MDGTVINSEVVYHKMIRMICEKYGKVYHKQLQKKLIGATDEKICETVVEMLKLPVKPAALFIELKQMNATYMAKAPAMKGVVKLLRHLHSNKVPLALATNATEQDVRLHATCHPKLFSLFHHMVTISDPEVYRGKPYPDVYIVAASRFPAKPKTKECLVFEDSPVGVEAAVAAKMQVVMTPDKRFIDAKHTQKATLVLPNLTYFRPEYFGLPPYPDRPKNNKGMMQSVPDPAPSTSKKGTENGKNLSR